MAELRLERKRSHKNCGGKVRFDGRETYACEHCGKVPAIEVKFNDFDMSGSPRCKGARV